MTGGGARRTSLAHFSNVLNDADRLGVWVLARIVGVETVDIGHQEEVVRVNHIGRDGRQRVVVAKLDLL